VSQREALSNLRSAAKQTAAPGFTMFLGQLYGKANPSYPGKAAILYALAVKECGLKNADGQITEKCRTSFNELTPPLRAWGQRGAKKIIERAARKQAAVKPL
jgi:hypothetical protein